MLNIHAGQLLLCRLRLRLLLAACRQKQAGTGKAELCGGRKKLWHRHPAIK